MNRKIIATMAVLLCTLFTANAQKFAVKSNLLYDATATINAGVEFGIAPKWTLDISGNYNNWTYAENRKTKHYMVQPEFRWWTCTRFSGGFVGFHLHGAEFNWGGMLPFGWRTGKMFGVIENPNIMHHRYDGWLAGAGVGYGYHWILGKRWSLEAEIGAGYAYIDYNKYKCEKCGEQIKSANRHYFGPTKAAISIIYFIR